MKNVRVSGVETFDKAIESIPGDKSISHRVAMFSLLSDKKSSAKNFLKAEDTLNSLSIAQKLGAKAEWLDDGTLEITPPAKIEEPSDILDCGNAGTGIRLYTGLLAGQEGQFILSGDKYLNNRPMGRVLNPLNSVGANITGRENNTKAPLVVRGAKLAPFNYESKIASAQVKTALILAGLFAEGESTYIEPELSRDHSERMLTGMGAKIESKDLKTTITPLERSLEPLNINVASDPSSAFFFAVAAAITPKAKVVLKNLSLNPTRIEAYKVLERMGAKIQFNLIEDKYEPIGDIVVENAPLKGVIVEENMSWLIDEIPALSIAFSVANGDSIVKNAEELRVKESDRIKSTVTNLGKCGVTYEEYEDGFLVKGGSPLKGAVIDSCGDHRIAMSFAIAALISDGAMNIEDVDCINTSFPNFFEILESLGANVEWK